MRMRRGRQSDVPTGVMCKVLKLLLFVGSRERAAANILLGRKPATLIIPLLVEWLFPLCLEARSVVL